MPDIPNRKITIGGPKFWLAYAAAAGNGMCSISFVNWCRARFGLPAIAEAKTEPFFLTGLIFLIVIGLWFRGTWYLLARRFKDDPNLEDCKRLLLLVFFACAPMALSLVLAQGENTYLEDNAPLTISLGVVWLLTIALPPASFSVLNPRHGFFCAALSWLTATGGTFGFAWGGESGFAWRGQIDLYVVGIRMAALFLYVTTTMRFQRVIAFVSAILSPCSPGLLGAVVGTVSWIIRGVPRDVVQTKGLKRTGVIGSQGLAHVIVESEEEPGEESTD